MLGIEIGVFRFPFGRGAEVVSVTSLPVWLAFQGNRSGVQPGGRV